MTVFFAPERIKKVLARKGLSAVAAAELAGVSAHIAYRILQGRGVKPESAAKFARAVEAVPNAIPEEFLADEVGA